MPGVDRLTIRRLTAAYEVAGDHPAPESVRQRLDSAVAALGAELGAALAPCAAAEREEVWLVRRIDLDLTLDAAADPALLRRALARGLARAIARKVDRAADGVLAFPDRTGYLARFLVDLATGDAWSRWYYEAFAGLRVLPVAAALRTALVADPEQGLQALARLAPAELAATLEALGAAEAARVLDELAGTAAGDGLGELLDHLETQGWPPVSPACPARLALALLTALAGRQPGRAAVTLVRASALLRHLLALGAELLPSLLEADRARLFRLAGATVAEALLPLLAAPAEARRRLARLAAPTPAPSTALAADRFTPFGGPFMLLQLLDEFPLAGLAGWPGVGDAPATTLVRALLLAKSVGGAAALAFLLDPVWRDLLGLPPAALPAALACWASTVTPARRRSLRRGLGPIPRLRPADRAFLSLPRALCPEPQLDRLLSAAASTLLERMARRLPGFAGSSPGYLARNFLAVAARVATTEDGLCVTLSRPPLDMVLGMTGLARATLRLDWLQPARLELRRGD